MYKNNEDHTWNLFSGLDHKGYRAKYKKTIGGVIETNNDEIISEAIDTLENLPCKTEEFGA